MHFLLIHGAWHGAWCYDGLIEALQARGAGATAIDLPGHGHDRSDPADVTMDSYLERARGALRELDRQVEVVGHSMAGAIITQLAATHPGYIHGLTYLCAFLPRQGDRLADMGAEDSGARLNAALRPGPQDGTLIVDPEGAREVFYHDCRPADADAAVAHLGAQATAPFGAAVHYDAETFAGVPRAYVLCEADRAITPAQQQRMIGRVGVDRTVRMATGHSPFLADPDGLAEVLLDIAASR